MTPELDNLISQCETYIINNDPVIRDIKRPHHLVKYLKEMRDHFIGLDSVKESIAQQVLFLINSNNKNADNNMLNVALTGPAGCGKSQFAKQISKILFALGFLEEGKNTGTFTAMIEKTGIGLSMYEILLIIAAILLSYGSYVISGLSKLVEIFGLIFVIIGIALVLIVALVVFLKYTGRLKWPKSKTVDVTGPGTVVPDEEFDEERHFRSFSRTDLISGYLGQTSSKTKRLLEENKHKVIFIDEAYSLVTDSRHDPYGLEALTTINLFLSENPKTIIILAGYDDMMTKLCRVQPGLARRFSWIFTFKKYSPTELFAIFMLKVNGAGLELADPDAVRLLFILHENDFPNSGGDVERLLFYLKLEISKDRFNKQEGEKVTVSQVERAINVLVSNHVDPGSPPGSILDEIRNL